MKNFRYYIFWLFDLIKGGKIKKHFIEIKNSFENLEYNKNSHNQNLINILSYAKNNSEFYKNITGSSLKDFPIIDKNIIIQNYEEIFSKEYFEIKDTLRVMSTSGSSGTPFRIHQNKEKVERNQADLLFFYKIGNYNIGDRMYFIRIWNSINKKNFFSSFKENFKMFDTSDLSYNGAERLKNVMLKDNNSKVILGYASSFTALMNHYDANSNIKWNIKSIITGAEELPLMVKEKMLKVFRCPVMSRYSNQENGILAQQPITGEDYFEINEGSYYFEFLKVNSDEPAQEDEIARIVITDFFNKAVPIIRYDTGDLAKFTYINGRKVITSIEGRKIDMLRNNLNEKISPHIITNLMWKFPEVKEFQLIQHSLEKVDFYISIVEKDTEISVLEKNIQNELYNIFKNTVEIHIVDSIPLEKSGKRKYIKSLIS
ncbi:hypothetical protein NZD85_08885 [Empedobacter stercoris]|uniref:Phenylacetate--CoA ligase family protein n=1 Tax=Empedobacter falsenii TaxID=343874 RepID=A0ABY8V3K6_9FLAO|nr:MULTISPECIES: hypothetical protein [Empedobacter]UWX66016.1 hypothetical protein NZD85_08885 [Empedobacter stercoris]WIH96241.1 hypothetical protein OBA43_08075 [Empedobacter falsenii]